MKLSDWARKQGIAYLTAYRWFKDDKLPVKAYQTESGTIIVEDEEVSDMFSSNDLSSSNSSDVMSLFLRKTVEFSKNDASVEDFAAWVISTFSLNFNSSEDKPKYSKLKPSSSQIMERYHKMINKGEKPKAQMFIPNNPKDLDDLISRNENLSAQDLIGELADLNCALVKTEPVDGVVVPIDDQLFKDLSTALNCGATSDAGSTSSSVFERIGTTPQNYANSTTTSNSLSSSDISSLETSEEDSFYNLTVSNSTLDLVPTDKEVEDAKNLADTRSVNIKYKKRGRGRPKSTEEEK